MAYSSFTFTSLPFSVNEIRMSGAFFLRLPLPNICFAYWDWDFKADLSAEASRGGQSLDWISDSVLPMSCVQC